MDIPGYHGYPWTSMISMDIHGYPWMSKPGNFRIRKQKVIESCCCCCNWEGLPPTWCLGPRHGKRTPSWQTQPGTQKEEVTTTCHGCKGLPFYQPHHSAGHRIALLSASPDAQFPRHNVATRFQLSSHSLPSHGADETPS